MPYIPEKTRPRLDKHIDKIIPLYLNTTSLHYLVEDHTNLIEKRISHGIKREDAILKLGREIKEGGDLNYAISKIIWTLFYNDRRYYKAEDLNGNICNVQREITTGNVDLTLLERLICDIIFASGFEIVSRVIGTLECIKLEFYIRHIRPYEDEKIHNMENGDLSDYEKKIA